jgi:hypothetical protein
MKKAFFLFCLFFSGKELFADHNRAGSISYQFISGYTYEITVSTLTNTCVTTADRCELTILFGDGDSGVAQRVNGIFPGSLCPTSADGVTVSNCSGCTKYNQYMITHTYSGPGNYVITMDDPNRATGIQNIANSGNTVFHLEAKLTIQPFLPPNTSSSNSNFDLIQCLCHIDHALFNSNSYDPDGDSLYYFNPLSGSPGYSDPPSLGGFQIDHSTGDVSWDHPGTDGIYVYDIRISEWKLVGGTRVFAGSAMMEIWNEVSMCMGINEQNENDLSVIIFQDPSENGVNFSIKNKPDKPGSLIVYNTLGKTVKIVEVQGTQNETFSINNLSPGMYFYSFYAANENLKRGKFMILQGSLK